MILKVNFSKEANSENIMREYPVLWSHISDGLWDDRTRKGFFPSENNLKTRGLIPTLDQTYTNVTLDVHNCIQNYKLIRDWLEKQKSSQIDYYYRIMGIFSLGSRCNGMQLDRNIHGLRFYFNDNSKHTANLFVMTFGSYITDVSELIRVAA